MTDLRPIDVSSLTKPAAVEAGAVPMLQWIEIKDLVVDDHYQRAPVLRAAQAIADRFDWRKFSAVVVAPIEGGLFAIIDGQHRCHAAAACGIERVPCQVTIMDRSEQARAFAAINGQATKVHALTMFKAAIAAGEPWAVEMREVCAAAILINRSHFVMHPRGVRWIGTSAGVAPTNAELRSGSNWERVYERKQVRIVAIKHRLTPAA